MAKTNNTEFRPLDIRRAINAALEDKNKTVICQKAHISKSVLSLYQRAAGGIEWQGLIRLLTVTGFKIYDPQGRLVLGDPDRQEEEIADNLSVRRPISPPETDEKA